jgi:hypothetical protein
MDCGREPSVQRLQHPSRSGDRSPAAPVNPAAVGRSWLENDVDQCVSAGSRRVDHVADGEGEVEIAGSGGAGAGNGGTAIAQGGGGEGKAAAGNGGAAPSGQIDTRSIVVDEVRGQRVEMPWTVSEDDVGEYRQIVITVSNSGQYHRERSWDDAVVFYCHINPPPDA